MLHLQLMVHPDNYLEPTLIHLIWNTQNDVVNSLHDNFFRVAIDKGNGKIAMICLHFYMQVSIKDLVTEK